MAFADPQTITVVGTTASTLPRVASGINSGAFQSADGTQKLSVSSTYGKRTRRVVRVDLNKIAADPFVAGQNDSVSMSAYVVIDVPKQGYSIDEQTAAVAGLAGYLTASTNAQLKKLLGGEN